MVQEWLGHANIAMTADIYSLQQILGHTSLEMVKRYVHLIPTKTIVSHRQFSPLDNLHKQQKKP